MVNPLNFQSVMFTTQVSNLFPRDEIDEITNELIPVMKKQHPRHPPTPENLYNFFINRARHNLHVALCFSPVSFSCFFGFYEMVFFCETTETTSVMLGEISKKKKYVLC